MELNVSLSWKIINITWSYRKKYKFDLVARSVSMVELYQHAWGDESWISPHTQYKRPGETRDVQCQSYRELFKSYIDVTDIHLIHKSTRYYQPVGGDRYKPEVDMKYNIKIGPARTRPAKEG